MACDLGPGFSEGGAVVAAMQLQIPSRIPLSVLSVAQISETGLVVGLSINLKQTLRKE